MAEAFISWRGGVCMPFTPTHTECVTPDGKWLGQHGNGGMLAKNPGYDHDDVDLMSDGRRCEIIISIPVTDAQHGDFYSYVHDKIGMPYDWVSILGFALTQGHFHTPGHLVCSAIMTAGLRHCGYLPWPLVTPFHMIDPRDLLLILSSHIKIDH